MASEMRFLEARLATFFKQEQQSNGRKGTSAPKWPHKSPGPEDLAKCGFYYSPMEGSDDNVTCFNCSAHLCGWEPSDSPAREHLDHSPECPWAVAMSATLENEEVDPMSQEMLQARIDTFGDSWPHEKKRGFKPKTKKLAEAGWSSTPTADELDNTTCWHCLRAVDGWEKSDDPMEEHRRGAPDCPFFRLADKFAASRPKKSRARTSNASRTSRLSSQSMVSAFSEVPSMVDFGDTTQLVEGDTSIGTVTSTASTTKGRKKAAAPKKASKSGRKKADKGDPDTTAMEATSVLVDESINPYASQLEVAEVPDIHKEEPAKKTTRGKGRPKKATAAESNLQAEDTSQLQSELNANLTEVEGKGAAAKAKRGKKRTSDGIEKVSGQMPEPVQEPVQEPAGEAPAPAAKKTKPVRSKKAKAAEAAPEVSQAVDAPLVMEEALEEAPVVKKGRKATKSTKATPMQPPAVIEPAEIIIDEDRNFTVHEESSNFVEHPDEEVSVRTAREEQSPTPGEFEASPTPKRAPMARSPLPKHVIDALSTTSTPQSVRSFQGSDAENQPPSTAVKQSKEKTSSAKNALAKSSQQVVPVSPSRTIRVPLASQTPNRQIGRQSPQKLGLLKSSNPWTASDVEAIFLAGAVVLEGRESSGAGVKRKLVDISGQLTSPEKKMTVEQWIRYQAVKAETALKDECEKLVSLFEREGVRALETLNGIDVHPV